ncbi:helix-turn-helix domain-containing protein [Kibdelosporangium philippinense]|uniref:Helix-turn-helix domain-containing protein n=1 Tax=Kibdelosporangium philippinense TaxID=211113 RepID=A0ABS8Z6S7_9PSEU|nr:helix-turn-helix domain-containing protein [Kibdelosporangium philippinense]MCE7002500.1 helix-turn-helix domain-containing protein [Kibdelosporangium philippinense]
MAGSPHGQRCSSCGARLAADNRSGACSPCARRAPEAGPPTVPDDFWDAPELGEAFKKRQFGRVLRAYRKAHPTEVTQAHVASWLGMTQAQISRLERGKSPANDLEKLDRWAQVLRIPQRCLWFTLSAESPDEYRSAPQVSNLPSSSTTAEGDSVQRRQFLKAVSGTGAVIVGGSLLATDVRQSITAPPNTVGNPEVDMVREMTQAFRRLDNRHGGGHGHVRAAVRSYLESTVEPLLRNGRSKTTVQQDLHFATAELYQLAGWIAYDTGQAGEGRQHLRHALRLCNEAGNDALAAEMLAAMSHHAAFFGSAEAAEDLALAARQTAKRTGLATLEAETAVMEAHALALRNDKKGSLTALRDAEKHFGGREHNDLPQWLGYFDGAYLAAKFAHTFRELGQPHEAEQFARRSLEMSDGYERGRLFNTALLASTLADQRRVEEACTTASRAKAKSVDLGSGGAG